MIVLRFLSRLLRPASLVALLGLSAAVGCGVDAYEARMKDTIEELKHENKFVGLSPKFMALTFVPPPGVTLPPEQVVEIAPRMRLPDRPRKFPEFAYRPDSQNPDNPGERIPENRVYPPAPLPQILGFQMEFEQMVTTSIGTRPWHLYIGVQRHPRGTPGQTAAYVATIIDTLKAEIAKEDAADLAAGIPPPPAMTELEWRDVTFLAARRGATPYTWKVLDINRPQWFYVQGNIPTKVPGIARMMVLDVPGKSGASDHTVTLMWRYPANAGAAAEIKDLITASMGTFEIDPVVAAAAGAPAKPN
jgi:hypothetical protein